MLAAKIRNYRTGVVHKDTTGKAVFGMYPLTMSKLSEPGPGNQDIYTVTVFLEQTTWGLWTLFSRIFAKKLTHTKDLPVGLLSKAISIFRKLVSPRIVVRFPNPLAQAGTLERIAALPHCHRMVIRVATACGAESASLQIGGISTPRQNATLSWSFLLGDGHLANGGIGWKGIARRGPSCGMVLERLDCWNVALSNVHRRRRHLNYCHWMLQVVTIKVQATLSLKFERLKGKEWYIFYIMGVNNIVEEPGSR